MKDLTFIIDWQTIDQSDNDTLHHKEFNSLDDARIFFNELKFNKDVTYIEHNAISIHKDLKCIGDII